MFEPSLVFVFLLVITGWILYKFLRRNENYFEERNVGAAKSVPVFGFMYEVIFKKRHIRDVFGEFYNQFSDSKFFGVFQFTKPVYVIRDLELIRQISIKNFDNFINHRGVFDEKIDNLFGKNLYSLRGERWRSMRALLSPAFTGSKMRHMFGLIAEISSGYMKDLSKKVKTEKEIEFIDFTYKYANDVIAKCAFGVSINSLANPNNDYFKAGLNISRVPLSVQLKLMGYSAFPKLMSFLKVNIFDIEMKKFFFDLVSFNIKSREQNNIKINDVMDLLMQAMREGEIAMENEKKYESAGFATVMESEETRQSFFKSREKWNIEDIAAQCVAFFLASFDTTSTSMYFMAHSLAVNVEVQKRLLLEIDDLKERLNGKLPSYEDIQSLTYLDMVLSECLRLHSPVSYLNRRCNEKTIIENSNGTKVELQPGDGVFIPISCIHSDPNFYPEPEKFIPERFSHENRDKIKPFSYLPFGVGPRNCIASRFALMEIKALFVSLLSNFTIETCSKTENPLRIKPAVFTYHPANGVWVSLKPR